MPADTPASPERLDPATLASLPALIEAATVPPWNVGRLDTASLAPGQRVRPLVGDAAVIGVIFGWQDDAPEEAEANARLLALAPTLARALLAAEAETGNVLAEAIEWRDRYIAAEAELARLRAENERLRERIAKLEAETDTRQDRLGLDNDGELDEVVMSGCVAHLERMDDDAWFLSLTRGRTGIAVWLARRKKNVVGNWEDRGDEPLPIVRWDDPGAAVAAYREAGEGRDA